MNLSNKRLKALDVFRGLTVALMILVNNGAGKEIYSELQHSKWNGLTLCDMVFPFFLFMVGMSTYLSLTKTCFAASSENLRKIGKRTLLLFLIGIAINWFDMLCSGKGSDLGHLRIWGVMQRIALCYGAVALLAVTVRHRYFPHIIIGLMIVYIGLISFGNGYGYYGDSFNIIAQVDLHLFGYDHLYHKSPVDPEGLLSTLPAIAHTMIGFWCCLEMQQPTRDVPSKIKFLKISGIIMVALGLFLYFIGFPINKRIWSPSYVFVTCGFAAWILGILIQYIDYNSQQGKDSVFTKTWLAFGTNPLFLYIMSEVLAILFGAFGIKDGLYNAIHALVTNGYNASLIYALAFVGIHIFAAILLYHKRIFIKI